MLICTESPHRPYLKLKPVVQVVLYVLYLITFLGKGGCHLEMACAIFFSYFWKGHDLASLLHPNARSLRLSFGFSFLHGLLGMSMAPEKKMDMASVV